jgi:hypothetical protein
LYQGVFIKNQFNALSIRIFHDELVFLMHDDFPFIDRGAGRAPLLVLVLYECLVLGTMTTAAYRGKEASQWPEPVF